MGGKRGTRKPAPLPILINCFPQKNFFLAPPLSELFFYFSSSDYNHVNSSNSHSIKTFQFSCLFICIAFENFAFRECKLLMRNAIKCGKLSHAKTKARAFLFS